MLTLAVLGDSIAYGQGADRPADTIGQRLSRALAADGTLCRVEVHAVPGARSAALAVQVRAALASTPDLALIVIGANDMTHFVPVPQAAGQLQQAVRELRRGGVEVVVVPAPDLSALPFVPVQFRPLVQAASAALRQAQSRLALGEGARVADVEGLSGRFALDVGLFSADRFHPSSRGYELIAQAVLPAVVAAARDAQERDSA
ncbi:SGNH/GDSL hydrolase family protein [Jatrophihabitans fulvus]